MPTPSSQDILLWVACLVVVIMVLVRSWAWVSKTVTVTNSLRTIPDLIEQVGLLATTMEGADTSISTMQSQVCALAEKVDRIEYQVSNTHIINMREDMDLKHEDSMNQLQNLKGEIKNLQRQGSDQMTLLANTIERQSDFDRMLHRLWRKIDKGDA